MGIIFSTLIMTVSSAIHNNNLSDDEIIKRAQALGMVMVESESEDGLFGNKDDSQKDSETESESESEPEIQKESQIDSEDTQQSQSTQESETASESQKESEESSETETPSESQEPTTQVVITQYVLHIQWGDTPKMVSRELEENGMIDSASAFRDYLEEHGYAGKLRSGSYTITKGMTYEEIAKMITKK